MNQTSPILAAALKYQEEGLCVIPIKTDGSKAPDGNVLPKGKWEGFQKTPPDTETVSRWWGNGTARGIGVVWGGVSLNGEALDFDIPGLHEAFAEVCAEHGLGEIVESMPLVETPSGGRHLYYRCTEPVQGNQKLAQRLEEVPEGTDGARLHAGRWVKQKTMIETRGEGGYTLAPGSPAQCHPNGKPYRFLRGRPATIPTITPEQRGDLLAIASTFNEYAEPEREYREPKARTPATGELRPGDDYNARGDCESVLERAGWHCKGWRGDKGLWQRPGKTGTGLSATSNYGGSGLFYVFSSNAAPFEPEKAYSPFVVYALLEHGGDFTEAAKELGRQGYGTPLPERVTVRLGKGRDSVEHVTPAAPVSEWPTLAPEALHGLAGAAVRLIEPHTEADPVALLVQFLLAFGSCIGRSAYYLAEADKHAGNLFAVLVGVSSKGRKGTSWGHIRRLFESVALAWTASRVLSGLSSGEGLIHAVRDPVEKEEKNKKTGEMETVLVDAGIEDKRLFVMESEFASVLRQTQRDGNTLSATLRNAWDTGTLRSMTKNSPAQATGAHVSIVGHITRDELRRDLAETETANGFGNRFLWVCVRRSKELPFGGDIDSVDFAPLLSSLQDALTHAGQMGRLSLDATAREVWGAVYHDLSTGKPGLLGAMTSRSEAQTMRLALLYALLDKDTAIRAEHLTAALALWEYCEASARYIFGDSLGDRVADDILRALRERPEGMTRSDLRELFGRNQSSERVGQALALLVEHGHARAEKQATEGRPVERWFAGAEATR